MIKPIFSIIIPVRKTNAYLKETQQKLKKQFKILRSPLGGLFLFNAAKS